MSGAARQNEKASDTRPCSTVRAFFEGLVRPSLPAVLGALLVVALGFGVCLEGLDESFVVGSGGRYLPQNPTDEYAFLTRQTLRVAAAGKSLDAVVFGTSVTREAITSRKALQAAVDRRLGRPAKVAVFCAGGLELWQAYSILENLERDADGVVVIEVGPETFTKDILVGLREWSERPRLGLSTPELDHLARTLGIPVRPRSSNYFLEHYSFFVARPMSLLNLLTGPPREKFHLSAGWRKPTELEWKRIIATRFDQLKEYPKDRAANERFLRALLSLVRNRTHAVPVLWSTIRNPRLEEALDGDPETREVLHRHERLLSDLASSYGGIVLHPGEALRLTPKDFLDGDHLIASDAREDFTRTFGGRIADALRKREGRDKR